MAVYRWIKRTPSDTGLRKGDVFDSSDFAPGVLDSLIRSGAVTPASTPPLSQLAGWTKRSARLEEIGIVSVGDLIEADSDTLDKIKDHFGYKTRNTIKKWQDEARAAVRPAQKKRG